MTIYLVRHGHAGSRSSWAGDDAERPLSKKGRDEADAVAEALADAGIVRLLSSPLLRCVQTLEPLAAGLGLPVEHHPALAEGSGPSSAVDLIDGHLDVTVALCSHGDVIPPLMAALQDRGLDSGGKKAAQKGGWWALKTKGGQLTKGVYHPPGRS